MDTNEMDRELEDLMDLSYVFKTITDEVTEQQNYFKARDAERVPKSFYQLCMDIRDGVE